MSKRKGLSSLLDDGLVELGAPPPPVPTQSSESVRVSAYCPIKKERTGAGTCRNVECGTCLLLAESLQETHPNHLWVCAECLARPQYRAQGFWADGDCEACGAYSAVLTLVTL